MKKATLTPTFSSMAEHGSEISHRVKEALIAISETVEVLKESESTGNTLVRDSKGRVFYCNSKDLSFN